MASLARLRWVVVRWEALAVKERATLAARPLPAVAALVVRAVTPVLVVRVEVRRRFTASLAPAGLAAASCDSRRAPLLTSACATQPLRQ